MKVLAQIESFKRKGNSPLTIDGENVYDLSLRDPKAAYDLVWKSVEGRGGLKAPREFAARQSCIRAAMAKPLPGAAGDAFLKGAVTVGDFTIYEVMPIHLKCLQIVDSPLLKGTPVASEDGKHVAIQMPEFEFQDEWNLCFIFTHDPEALYDTPKSKLKEVIESEGRRLFKPSRDGVVNAATVNGICSAIMRQFERHHATTIRHESEMDNAPEKKSSPA